MHFFPLIFQGGRRQGALFYLQKLSVFGTLKSLSIPYFMNNAFLESMKGRLLKEKQDIEKGLERFASRDAHDKEHFHPKFPDMTDKTEDSAGEVSQYTDELALEQNLEKSLKHVDHALERIQKGTYGVCEVCGVEINPNRLEANPYATTCIDHAK